MGCLAGIRNLDAPHLPSRPLTFTNSHRGSRSPTPCKREQCVDASLSPSSVSSVGSASESNGLVMPVAWPIADGSEADADTVIISTTTVVSTLESQVPGGQGTLSVIVLESDEESSNSSGLVNSSVLTTRSAHSSDIFYTDEAYDRAFAAYIEEEDNNAGNGTGEVSTACVLPE